MNRKQYGFLLVVLVAGMLAACAGGEAPTAAPATQAPESTAAATQAVETQAPAADAPTAEATATQEATTAAPAVGGKTFVIDQSQSTAHFLINEVLLGQPKQVDGVTNLVEGQITVDYANPAAAAVGPIKVDLTGLKTDSGSRTGQVQHSILQTDVPANRYAVFTTTKIDGLPSAVTIGQAFSFKITGTLDLHGASKEVTFDASVTPVSATQLSGTASLDVVYGDWGVQILHLPPQVASADNHTILKLEFVANAQ